MVDQVLKDYQHQNNVFVDLVLMEFDLNEMVVENEIWQHNVGED